MYFRFPRVLAVQKYFLKQLNLVKYSARLELGGLIFVHPPHFTML